MKRHLLLLAAGVFIATLLHRDEYPHSSLLPAPTHQEEGTERIKRKAWLELMHQSAPGTDWQQVEYQNRYRKHQKRLQSLSPREDCGTISIANGQVQGQWQERGSGNQAGSIFNTFYDAETNQIWLISAGGTLWRGPRDGTNWQVVNQDLQFDPGILKFIPIPGGRRLLAFAGRIPHYSDDEGHSWMPAEGIRYADRWGYFHHPVILNDEQHSYYFLQRPSYRDKITLYKSIDRGERFQPVKDFETSDFSTLALCKPHHSNELLLVEKTKTGFAKISRINAQTDAITPINFGNELKLGEAPANLVGWAGNQMIRLYAYSVNNGIRVHATENYGINWQAKGFLNTKPWDVGLYVLPSNPDALLMGEVECYRSLNGGNTWTKVNNWWDYYNNVENKLHADIMNFSEFIDNEGIPFLLISHHGGLTISEDYLDSQQNISLWGLNTSQYYSVRTDPHFPAYVYAGSQDQGFQLADGFDTPGMKAFKQVTSGDYGHLVFSNSGQSLWTVYPGGDVSYYANAQTGRFTAGYELESENESVWLPPLMESPFANENAIYMAGGNVNGGKGSHIIRLEADRNEINVSQLPFNFKTESGGGEISAIASSTLNPDLWYVATTNGRFFYSVTGGLFWIQNLNFVPDGHYLYGQTIYPSKTELGTVYLGGSGYSNPPVYKSPDGGKTFVSMSEGLPNTLVLAITGNADESLLFAATEAGPFVYVRTDERWYDLSGQCAPAQTYWSVEFVESLQTVRFGTYGRGIWDFKLDETVNITDPQLITNKLNVFPNPSDGNIQVQLLDTSNPTDIFVFDVNGKIVYRSQFKGGNIASLQLAHLARGTYFVQTISAGRKLVAKILLK